MSAVPDEIRVYPNYPLNVERTVTNTQSVIKITPEAVIAIVPASLSKTSPINLGGDSLKGKGCSRAAAGRL